MPNRPDTAPAATVEACIQICKELFHPAPDRKTSCGAAAWNGPSKQCYLKTHKAKPVRAPAAVLNLPCWPYFPPGVWASVVVASCC